MGTPRLAVNADALLFGSFRKSSSISPNCSLIYQLVEWERVLSREASKLRDTLGEAAMEQGKAGVGWSNEVLDEEEWTRMRLEEERKEQAELEESQARNLEEARKKAAKLAAERKAQAREAEEVVAAGGGLGAPSSLSARRRRRTPSLMLSTGAGGANNSSAPVEAPLPSAKPFASFQRPAGGPATRPLAKALPKLTLNTARETAEEVEGQGQGDADVEMTPVSPPYKSAVEAPPMSAMPFHSFQPFQIAPAAAQAPAPAAAAAAAEATGPTPLMLPAKTKQTRPPLVPLMAVAATANGGDSRRSSLHMTPSASFGAGRQTPSERRSQQ